MTASVGISGECHSVLKRRIKMLGEGIRICFIYCEPKDIIGIKDRQELPPLGLLYLAGTLIDAGFSIDVVPFSNAADIDDLLSESDIYCFSITATVVYEFFVGLSEKVRSKHPDALILAGGTHPSIFPEDVLVDLALDAVIVGEGEHPLLVLLDNIIHGMKSNYDLFRNVPGAVFRVDNRIIRNTGIYVKDIDALSLPCRKILSPERIVLKNRIKIPGYENNYTVTLITSRGCPYACRFCANLNNGSYRRRSASNIALELESISSQYPQVSTLLIMDETATLSSTHLNEWTHEAAKYGYTYIVSTRGDELNRKKVRILADTGCMEVKIGMETGSPTLLHAMNKQLSLEQLELSLRLLKEAGIQVKVFLMHGFPGENMSTTRDTIRFLQRNESFIDRAVLYQFAPLPGSYVFRHPDEFNLINGMDNNLQTIYDNSTHWWGSDADYQEMIKAYAVLQKFVNLKFRR